MREEARALGLALAVLSVVLVAGSAGAQNPPLSKVQVVRGADSTPPVEPQLIDLDLREVAPPAAWNPGDPVQVIPKLTYTSAAQAEYANSFAPPQLKLDPLLAVQASAPTVRAFTAPILNFAGQGYTGVQPPDTVGDVGQNYYIQMINGSGGSPFTIYNKSDGSVAAGPIGIDIFATGDCTNGRGDPIVLYDHLADRWLLTEFSNTGNRLCVYLSQTSDPVAGGWLFYEFQAPSFPDYPKYAVWPDAYYIGTNESTPALYAIDRTQMLLGASATMQRFTASPLAGFGFQMLIPADLDGETEPPTGSPAYFLRHRDDESHNSPGTANDFLEIFEFHADFDTPANSTLTGPTLLTVTEFDSNLCGLTSFSCVPQPGGGSDLDPLREVVMWRAAYRNFGTHEALIGNFVTDVGDFQDHHGIRWFELQQTASSDWSLFQEGTYAPDATHRWMGSIAMDGFQNIALGYSVSSTSVNPGMRYTGRLQSDPAGTLPQPETTLQAGNGVHSGNRWGDYSAMSVDPADDCTFWHTNEFAEANGNWNTRIGSFKFDACSAVPGIGLAGTNLEQEICAPAALADIEVSVTGQNGFTDDVTLSFQNLATGFSGSFSANPVTPPGTSTASVGVSAAASSSAHQFLIRGSGTGVSDVDLTVEVQVSDEAPGVPTLSTPANTATLVSSTPTFSWAASSQAATYTIEVDDDPAFGSIDFTSSGKGTTATPGSALNPGTEYFWRVRAINACGTGADSTTFSFTTAVNICSSPAVAIPDNSLAGVSDTLAVGVNEALTDLDVSIELTHTYVGDLSAILTHTDTGTSVVLLDRPGKPPAFFGCSGDDVNATLDDEATSAAEDECSASSPAIGGSFTPTGALSVFDGESLAGTWSLTVIDNEGLDTGALGSWCLLPTTQTQLCSGVTCTALDSCHTVGTCDPATGVCSNPNAASGTTCGDASTTECSLPDTCDGAGTCQPNDSSSATTCGSAGTDCVIQDLCDGSGSCTDNGFVADGSPCDDGAFCNGSDSCSSGNCVTQGPAPCVGPDGDGDCAESCDESTDTCTLADVGGSLCDDAEACTANDICDGAGSCAGSAFTCNTPLECETGPGTCTGSGCSYPPSPEGAACNDGLFCTVSDACTAGGACEGQPSTCNPPESCSEATQSCLSRSVLLTRDQGESLATASVSGIASALTIEAWLKLASQPSEGEAFAIVSKSEEASDARSFHFFYQWLTGEAGPELALATYVDGTGATGESCSVPVTLDFDWNHVAVSYDAASGQCQFYLDGGSIGSPLRPNAPAAIFDTSTPIRIGAHDIGLTNGFDGNIDEVRVWDIVRASAQISDSFGCQELALPEGGLLGYWRLNDSNLDSSGNGNDLVLNTGSFSVDIPCIDSDGDGIFDASDICPSASDPSQIETVTPGTSGNIGAACLCGDVDDTGTVNIVDAQTVAQVAVGTLPLSSVPIDLSEVNRDGNLNIVDAQSIAITAVGSVHACDLHCKLAPGSGDVDFVKARAACQ